MVGPFSNLNDAPLASPTVFNLFGCAKVEPSDHQGEKAQIQAAKAEQSRHHQHIPVLHSIQEEANEIANDPNNYQANSNVEHPKEVQMKEVEAPHHREIDYASILRDSEKTLEQRRIKLEIAKRTVIDEKAKYKNMLRQAQSSKAILSSQLSWDKIGKISMNEHTQAFRDGMENVETASDLLVEQIIRLKGAESRELICRERFLAQKLEYKMLNRIALRPASRFHLEGNSSRYTS